MFVYHVTRANTKTKRDSKHVKIAGLGSIHLHPVGPRVTLAALEVITGQVYQITMVYMLEILRTEQNVHIVERDIIGGYPDAVLVFNTPTHVELVPLAHIIISPIDTTRASLALGAILPMPDRKVAIFPDQPTRRGRYLVKSVSGGTRPNIILGHIRRQMHVLSRVITTPPV